MRIITVLAAAMSLANSGALWATAASDAGGSLSRYLQQAVHVKETVHFQATDVDLDRDRIAETIAFVDDPRFCGTGGCDALVLKRVAGGYRSITLLSVTHLPIRVLPSRSHGWSDLGVTVVGGGILVAYEARLRFNGRSYPTNPAVAPAEPLPRVIGRIVLGMPNAKSSAASPPTAFDR